MAMTLKGKIKRLSIEVGKKTKKDRFNVFRFINTSMIKALADAIKILLTGETEARKRTNKLRLVIMADSEIMRDFIIVNKHLRMNKICNHYQWPFYRLT